MSLYTQLYVYIVCPFQFKTTVLPDERRNPLVLQNYTTLFEMQIKSINYDKLLKFKNDIWKKKPLLPLWRCNG